MLTARKRSWLICLALIGLIAVVYWPVQNFEFLLYDDTVYVSLNEHVHRGLSWSQVAWAFTTRECNMWHPLTWLSHLLDWQLFGSDAGKHHIAPVLFHIGSSIALFFAWKRMTRQAVGERVSRRQFLHCIHCGWSRWRGSRNARTSRLGFSRC